MKFVPNTSLESTATAVTIPAAKEVAPAVVAADLERLGEFTPYVPTK